MIRWDDGYEKRIVRACAQSSAIGDPGCWGYNWRSIWGAPTHMCSCTNSANYAEKWTGAQEEWKKMKDFGSVQIDLPSVETAPRVPKVAVHTKGYNTLWRKRKRKWVVL